MSSILNKDTCCPCTCSPCRSCLAKLCQSCCPYLSINNDRYAAVKYRPVEPTIPTQEYLYAARKSLCAVPTQHFPHQSDPTKEDDNSLVITEEPKPSSDLKDSQSYVSVSEYSRSQSDMQLSADESSSCGSLDEIGVGVGFVDYERAKLLDDRNIRVCRTPEYMLGEESDLCDDAVSDSEECSVAIRAQTEEALVSPDVHLLRHRSAQVERDASPHKPCVLFSLYFDEKHSILIVHLLKAFCLPTKRAESTSNPFAEVYLLPNKAGAQESRVMHQTLNPIFDQAFKFTSVSIDGVRKQMLVIRIYVHGKHHFIGGILFNLDKANLFGSSITVDITAFDEEEGLKDKSKGDILLSMTHHPEAGTLEVLLLEASHLKKQDLIGLPNPYVKVNLILKGTRISKWRSTTLKNTLNPVFNELCVLDIGSMNTEALEIEVVVMDYDRFGRNSDLGSIIFGSNVVNESGKKQWEAVVNNPNVSHMCWHVISASDSLGSRLRSPIHSKNSPASCTSATGQ